MKSMLDKFIETYVELPLTEKAKEELAKIMCRCWAYGYNGGNYRDFRSDFDLGKNVPEKETELKI